jgi:hypothetical protein
MRAKDKLQEQKNSKALERGPYMMKYCPRCDFEASYPVGQQKCSICRGPIK